MWWKNNKGKLITVVIIAAVLAGAFWYGGDAPGMRGWKLEEKPAEAAKPELQTETAPETPKEGQEKAKLPEENSDQPAEDKTEKDAKSEIPAEDPPAEIKTEDVAPEVKTDDDVPEVKTDDGGQGAAEPANEAAAIPEEPKGSTENTEEQQGMIIDPATGKDKYLTDPVPEGKPIPVEPQDAVITDVAHTCTISISCSTILDNLSWLDPEKTELVPEDGWILEPVTVTFYEGESVFNVLQRVCKQKKIHMEFENTPMYNSAYIEGIGNLYEFDCGDLSGWMYKVNGWFPNYGCSRYSLKDGDVICWVYTCDLGNDVGGGYSTGN